VSTFDSIAVESRIVSLRFLGNHAPSTIIVVARKVKEAKDFVEVKRLNGKIVGAIVGAILVAALFGIVRLWGRGASQERSYGQTVQKNK